MNFRIILVHFSQILDILGNLVKSELFKDFFDLFDPNWINFS